MAPRAPKRKSEQRAGEGGESRSEAGAERGEEAAGVARSVGASIQELSGNSESAAEKVGVDTEQAGEALQGGHLALKRGVGEGELIFLGLAGFRNSFLTREFIGEFAEAGGVSRTRQAILRGLLERVKGAGERALGLAGDGSFVGRTEARIVQNALILRKQEIADLLLLAKELLVERVQAGELLIGELASVVLGAGHEAPRNWKIEIGKWKFKKSKLESPASERRGKPCLRQAGRGYTFVQ